MQLHQLHQGNVHGNSATATKLATARNIKLQGAVSGNVNFDGSGNITITTVQSNIAVIEGSMTLTENTQEELAAGDMAQTILNINFPSGFNKDNCICIGFGSKTDSNKNYSYGTVPEGSATIGLSTGAVPKQVVLGSATDSSKIMIMAYNKATSAKTLYYKIILMKIA